MKISYLLTQDLESPSASGRYLPICKELSKLGHKTNIITTHGDFNTVNTREFERSGVQIHYVGPMHVSKKGNSKKYYNSGKLLLNTSYSTLQLTKAALISDADIIHIGKPHPMNSIAGLTGRYLQNKTVFLDCDDFEEGSGKFKSDWQRTVIRLFERQVPHRVHQITTNTHFMRSKLIDWGVPESKVHFIPNGIDREWYRACKFEEIKQLKYSLDLEGKRVIAYIGTIGLISHPIDLLLSAFTEVLSIFPDAILLIVGGGEDYDAMRSYCRSMGIEKQVRWVGKVPADKVSMYYQLAEVSVDPVHDDDASKGRSPLKLFESWASGVPFVTGDVGDRKFLLGHPSAGMIVRPGDPRSIACAILEILNNDNQTNYLKESGYSNLENYYWDKICVDLIEVYNSFAARLPTRK